MNPEIYRCSQILKSNNLVKGNLYLGGIESLKQVKEFKIGAIISAVEIDVKIPPYVHHLKINAYDEINFDMKSHFLKAIKFITLYLRQTNVLVHCQVGVSRSASLVISYFIKEQNMNYEDAFKFVQSKRDFIAPNNGFVLQLQQFSQQCKNQTLTKQEEQLQPKKLQQQILKK